MSKHKKLHLSLEKLNIEWSINFSPTVQRIKGRASFLDLDVSVVACHTMVQTGHDKQLDQKMLFGWFLELTRCVIQKTGLQISNSFPPSLFIHSTFHLFT